MKTMNWAAGIMMAGMLASVGCSKTQQQQEGPPALVMGGVKLDLPKLQQSLAADKPQLQATVGKVMTHLRYGQYPDALAELDKLSAAGLTDAQKKLVADVIEQVKQLMAKSSPKPAR
jgi:hypothetical protein